LLLVGREVKKLACHLINNSLLTGILKVLRQCEVLQQRKEAEFRGCKFPSVDEMSMSAEYQTLPEHSFLIKGYVCFISSVS
jgi:hypothetical protein